MDLTTIFVTGIIFVTFYKIIFLFARRKERMMLIDKLDRINMTPPEFRRSLDSILRDLGDAGDSDSAFSSARRFSALRWGSACLGGGLGLLTGFIITMSCRVAMTNWNSFRQEGIVYGSCILLFIGIAMIIAFIVENKMRSGSEKKNSESESQD